MKCIKLLNLFFLRKYTSLTDTPHAAMYIHSTHAIKFEKQITNILIRSQIYKHNKKYPGCTVCNVGNVGPTLTNSGIDNLHMKAAMFAGRIGNAKFESEIGKACVGLPRSC